MPSETKQKCKNLAVLERESILKEQGTLFSTDKELGLVSQTFAPYLPRIKVHLPQTASEKFQIKSRRFIGNKHKLLDFIENVITQNVISYNSFCDLFAGTG